MFCEKSDSSHTSLICERCYDEAHMMCLTPPMTEVPPGIDSLTISCKTVDFAVAEDWFCPKCRKEAPLTVKQADELFRKKGISNSHIGAVPIHQNKPKSKGKVLKCIPTVLSNAPILKIIRGDCSGRQLSRAIES